MRRPSSSDMPVTINFILPHGYRAVFGHAPDRALPAVAGSYCLHSFPLNCNDPWCAATVWTSEQHCPWVSLAVETPWVIHSMCIHVYILHVFAFRLIKAHQKIYIYNCLYHLVRPIVPLPPMCTSAESGRQGQNAQEICFDRQTHAAAVMHLTRSSTRVKSLGLVDKLDVLYITSGFLAV